MYTRFSIVVAYDPRRGIGRDGGLPWKFSEDLKFFRQITSESPNSAVIMGRKTFQSIPKKFRPLKNRVNIVLSRSAQAADFPGTVVLDSFEATLRYCSEHKLMTFVAGGGEIYRQAARWWFLCDAEYVTELFGNYNCDKRYTSPRDFLSANTKISREQLYSANGYDRYRYSFSQTHDECKYLKIARQLLADGEKRPNRTDTDTISLFGQRLEFDISNSLPLLTSKRVAWKTVIKELLWFIRGSTDVTELQQVGVKIWNGNSSREFLDARGLTDLPEGDIGAGYGHQWRHFGAEYKDCKSDYTGKGVDQLQEIIRLIKDEPSSRRIILSAWNPAAMYRTALPACHLLCQFHVSADRKFLDCQMYQRSGDYFLGVPFNIASYAILTYMIAHVTGLKPRRFYHVLGDTHIYENHINAIKIQLTREPKPFPTLRFGRNVPTIDDFKLEDFIVEDYAPHPFIKGTMAV